MSQINVGIVNSTGGVQLPSFTTANLPTTGISAGFLAFDSTDGVVKVYDGNSWKKLTDATVNATGGDEVYSQGQYKIHKFYNSGTFNVVDSDANAYMDFLIVGGGGGGGCSDGNCSNGGGGAGGRHAAAARACATRHRHRHWHRHWHRHQHQHRR